MELRGNEMHLKVHPGELNGTVSAPPSKSHTHRAFILGLLADGSTTIKGPLICGHTLSTLKAINAFGAKIEQNNDYYTIHTEKLRIPKSIIDVGNSGTALRLLCGVASLLNGKTKITGDKSVIQRPIEPLLNALNQLGANCKSVEDNGMAPVIIRGVINKECAKLPGDISSQFLSSLLISCPLKTTDTTIELTTKLVSHWYVALTIDMMHKFNVEVKTLGNGQKFFTKRIQKYEGIDYEIPGDYASASFILVGAAITDGRVRIQNLDPRSPQGDRAILEILQRAGADVKVDGNFVQVSGGELNGVEVDCANIPDLFPILAVLGAYAKGRTRLFRAGHVKYKESNRIETTANMLRAMGADIKVSDDEMLIKGGKPLETAIVNPMGDHRMLMASVIAGLGVKKPIKILGAQCHRNSYPNFINDIKKLGGKVEERP